MLETFPFDTWFAIPGEISGILVPSFAQGHLFCENRSCYAKSSLLGSDAVTDVRGRTFLFFGSPGRPSIDFVFRDCASDLPIEQVKHSISFPARGSGPPTLPASEL